LCLGDAFERNRAVAQAANAGWVMARANDDEFVACPGTQVHAVAVGDQVSADVAGVHGE
jgi:hypothetical protein